MMDSASVLDFISLKNYPDMTLDMLNPLGESFLIICHAERRTEQHWYSVSIFFIFPAVAGKPLKKEPEHEDAHQHFDDTAKLLQEFQDAAVDRVGSRPSSNLSSLSNASERDQHHLGITPHITCVY